MRERLRDCDCGGFRGLSPSEESPTGGRSPGLPLRARPMSRYIPSPGSGGCNFAEYRLMDFRRRMVNCSGRITVFSGIIASGIPEAKANLVLPGPFPSLNFSPWEVGAGRYREKARPPPGHVHKHSWPLVSPAQSCHILSIFFGTKNPSKPEKHFPGTGL